MIPKCLPYSTELPQCALSSFKTTGKTCGKLYTHLYFEKRSAKDLSNDPYVLFLSFFLIFFIKACVVGTNLNCIDLSMQFK